MKKFLSTLLSVCILLSTCSFFALSSFAEGETTGENTQPLSWDNGNILDVLNASGKGADAYKYDFDYRYDETVFKYVFFNGGTYPPDGLSVGYYDMVKADDGYYRGTTDSSTNGNLYNTSSGAVNASATWHYTPGICFTAPETGTVDFTYQYAYLHNANGRQYDFVIVKNEVDFRDLTSADIIFSGTTKKTMGFGDYRDDYEEVTVRVDVQKGDRIYFMANGLARDGGERICHWISSARYVNNEATLLGHGLAATDTLDLRFLVQMTDPSNSPTATVTVNTPFGMETQTVVGQIYLGEKKDGGYYTAQDHVYAFTVALNAKQMTDEVVISLNNTSFTDTYTVEQYCLGILELAKENDAYSSAAETCAAILLYGRMAQLHFNYNTDKLPKVDKALLESVLNEIQ